MDERLIGLISAGISVAAAFTSALLSLRSLRAQGLANRVQIASVRNQYFVELRRWADEACIALSEASHLCDLIPSKTANPNYFDRCHRLHIHLSALIDRGRWFLPNRLIEIEGQSGHKAIAFAGYRHEVLDCLVAAYREIDPTTDPSEAENSKQRDQLEKLRKSFVSQIQAILDPRGMVREFDRINKQID